MENEVKTETREVSGVINGAAEGLYQAKFALPKKNKKFSTLHAKLNFFNRFYNQFSGFFDAKFC